MTVCETKIVYNSIQIRGVLTEEITYDPVYDSTNTDIIGIHTRVTVLAYVHDNEGNWIHGTPTWTVGAATMPQGLTALFRELSMPRKPFIMSINDEDVFNILPTAVEPNNCNRTPVGSGLNQDIAHGPRCTYRVIGIQGQHTARCQFVFEFTTPICDNNEEIRDFLNLRYWIADDVDCTTWLTKRTYQGVLRVKGMQVNSHQLARTITLPPIQKHFRRESINWSESPDHLELHFTIRDVEITDAAPCPATHWEGTYSVSIPQGDINSISELRFRLWGDRNTDRVTLFKLAQSIIDTKLNYTILTQPQQIIVESQVWEEKLDAHEVSVYMRIRNTGPDRFTRNVMASGDFFELGKPLGASASAFTGNPGPGRPEGLWAGDHDPDQSYWPPDGLPTASLAGIFIAALQTPCCPQRLCQEGTYEADRITCVSEDTPPTLVRQNAYTPLTHRYSYEHMEKPYIWYRITNRYHRDTGWRGFPLGSQCAYTSTSDRFAFAQIHCNICTREVRIEAARINAWPELPDPRDSWTDPETNIKYVLRDVKIDPNPPQLSADGRHEIREVYASYFYYMSRPPTSEEEYLVGLPKYIDPSIPARADQPPEQRGDRLPPPSLVYPYDILGKFT
jgi:hypothetical protein